MENNENLWDYIKEIAEKADRMGRIDRDDSDEDKARKDSIRTAKIIRIWFNSFCVVGFSEDQALEIVLTMLGGMSS